MSMLVWQNVSENEYVPKHERFVSLPSLSNQGFYVDEVQRTWMLALELWKQKVETRSLRTGVNYVLVK